MRMRTGLLALAAATVCGCGTTVSTAGPSSSGLGVPAATSTAAAGATGSEGPAGAAAGGAAGSAGAGSQAAPGTGADTTTTTSGTGTRTLTAHAPIDLGIGVDGNNGPFAAAFGVSNSQPSEKVVAAAIVAWLNRHGGLAGHPIRPVFAVFDNTSNNWVSQDQAMCALFTQDNHVAAVVRTDDIFGPLDACLAQTKTPLVLWESVFRPGGWWNAAPGLRFTPDEATGARTYAALTDRMVATGRWKPSTRIGLVRYDRSDQAQVQSQGLAPALAAHGLRLSDSEAVHTPESFQDIGTTSSDLAGAVLRMRQKGITSVVFMGGDVAYLFAQEATSQRYYPAYALTSFDFPNLLPASALGGAFGIGWDPSDDVTTPIAATTGVKRCQEAAAGTGVTWSATGADRFYTTCDELFFLQAAYDAAGSVAPGALVEGARRVGAGMAPSLTFRVDTARHPDGLAAYRDLEFAASCSCLRYGSLFALDS